MTNIAVATLTIGAEYTETVSKFVENTQLYCKKHGYYFLTEDEQTIYDNEREPLWYKVLLMSKNLHKFDFIVWIDADAMVMHHEVKLEDFITLYMRDKDMMMSMDVGGHYNTGVWFIRNSLHSQYILDMIYKLPELTEQHHEQSVHNKIVDRSFFGHKDKVKIFTASEQRIFNPCHMLYNREDFIIHMMGVKRTHLLRYLGDLYFPHQMVHETYQQFRDRVDNLQSSDNCLYTKPQPKIKIVYFACGDKYREEVIKYGKRSLVLYCEKYGYEFIHETEPLQDELPPHWNKMLIMRKHMTDDTDFVVWIDADVMICNHEIKLTDIIKKFMQPKHDFLLCRDVSGHINTGVWFAKNTEYARNLLDLTYKLPELRYRNCEDQDTWNQLYIRNICDAQNKIAIVDDQKEFNCCCGLYKYGYFLIHLMSLGADGLMMGFDNFYPFRRDNENDHMFEYRLNWIKQTYPPEEVKEEVKEIELKLEEVVVE